MEDKFRQTGRTTEMLLKMLVSQHENNYYVSLNYRMSNYHRDMFLDILENLKFKFEANIGDNTVTVRHKRFKFISREYKNSMKFRNDGAVFFDHTCIGVNI